MEEKDAAFQKNVPLFDELQLVLQIHYLHHQDCVITANRR